MTNERKTSPSDHFLTHVLISWVTACAIWQKERLAHCTWLPTALKKTLNLSSQELWSTRIVFTEEISFIYIRIHTVCVCVCVCVCMFTCLDVFVWMCLSASNSDKNVRCIQHPVYTINLSLFNTLTHTSSLEFHYKNDHNNNNNNYYEMITM